MKKGLLATTALIGAGALMAGAAGAAEAPTWKLSGNMNFQFYWIDQDAVGASSINRLSSGTWEDADFWRVEGTKGNSLVFDVGTGATQDHGWYFGVDEAELALKVDGTADNGLKYGFKIEIQVNTDDGTVADEARIQLAGSWGTLQLGDEDGAEDTMNYGGENLMGGTGGFDGDYDDVLYKAGGGVTAIRTDDGYNIFTKGGLSMSLAAPSGPSIAGDSSDHTKITYYSPRFSGFQVGASITPAMSLDGDEFKKDGAFENHIGLGANYDNSFGGVRIRASAVYSTASATGTNTFEDIGAWSVGGIVGFGPFSIGANYTDNSDSGQPIVYDGEAGAFITAPIETSHYNVAASFSTGPMSFAVGYFVSTKEFGNFLADSTYEVISLTADYTAAPGLAFYADIGLVSEELIGGIDSNYDWGSYWGNNLSDDNLSLSNDATVFILGVQVSF